MKNIGVCKKDILGGEEEEEEEEAASAE